MTDLRVVFFKQQQLWSHICLGGDLISRATWLGAVEGGSSGAVLQFGLLSAQMDVVIWRNNCAERWNVRIIVIEDLTVPYLDWSQQRGLRKRPRRGRL